MASGADQGFFGFKHGYWRLSYRGRFLFDLIGTPFGAALVAACIWWWYRPANITGYWFVGVFVLIGFASAAVNYICWQAESQDTSPGAKQVSSE